MCTLHVHAPHDTPPFTPNTLALSLPPQLQFHVSVLRTLHPLLIHSHIHQHFLVSPALCIHISVYILYILYTEDAAALAYSHVHSFVCNCHASLSLHISTLISYRHTAHSTAAHTPGRSLWEDSEDHRIHCHKVEDGRYPHGL